MSTTYANNLVAMTRDTIVHKWHFLGGKSTFSYKKNVHSFIKFMSLTQHTAVLITVLIPKPHSCTPLAFIYSQTLPVVRASWQGSNIYLQQFSLPKTCHQSDP